MSRLLKQMITVQAHDISQTGIAFYLPERPETKSYLIRLGEVPNAMLLLCEVSRIQQGYWNRMRQYRVGTTFVRRIPF